jgi:levanbiose-producing levanase
MDLYGYTAEPTWVIVMGANGYHYNRPTQIAYWTGKWDGQSFVATNRLPQWMDDGPDVYATVSWENPKDTYGSRYAIAWMNNWDYAPKLPYYGDFPGQTSLIREVKLKTVNGSSTLVSSLIIGWNTVESSNSVSGKTITTDPNCISPQQPC